MHPHPGIRTAAAAFAAALLTASAAGAADAGALRLTRVDDAPVPGFLYVAPSPFRVGQTVFFPASDPKNGDAMWASDGSAPRATLLIGARAQAAVSFGGRAFFIGTDSTSSKLWKSDGSPAGTTPVAELGGPYAGSLAAIGDALYLWGGDVHPWTSDGTAAGTLRLSDEATVEGGFVEWNGSVYFLALGGDSHLGLWATEGTPGSTRRVADLGDATEASRSAYGLTSYGGRLYFYTMEEGFGARYRLWTWIGGNTSAAALRDFPGTFGSVCPGQCFGIGPETLAGLGGRLDFFADDGVHGRELWQTDGTPAGTQLLADVSPGAGAGVSTSFQDPQSTGASASYALFGADDGVHGDELWRTDGTAAGTYLLADLSPGPDDSYPYGFVAVGDQFFFTAAHPRPGDPFPRAIYRTDGTASGTVLFRDGAAQLYPIEGGFAAVDGDGIWVSDGATFTLVDDLSRPRGLEPFGLTAFGDGLAFSRLDADNTLHDLWRYDAGAGAAGVVHHFARLSTLPEVARGAIYLGADDGVHGVEPWVSDGTEAGTRLLHEIAVPTPDYLGAFDSDPDGFTAAGSSIYFTAWDGTYGAELWLTDGTDAGTRLVQDFQPGIYGSVPGDLTPFRGALAFSIAFPQGGLWTTDGTTAGTRETAPMPASSVVAAGATLYFIGYDAATGNELWRSDGTPQGTRLVKDAVPGPGNQNLYALTPAGDRIFYLAQASDHSELWTSDGTEAGTRSVAALRAMGSLTAVGARVFFYADDGQHGFELWTSDGTPGGTRLVRDIAPGLASSFPTSLGAAGGRLFFAADDGVHGIEPWVSDGTAEGTHLLEDLSPGPASSSPSQFVASGDVVYFAASDDEAGKQIWSIPAQPDETVTPRGRPRTPRVAPPRD